MLYEASEASFIQWPLRRPQNSRITNISFVVEYHAWLMLCCLPSLVPRVQRHGRLLCSPGSAMKIGMSGKRHACCQVPLHIAWPRLHPASSYAPEAIQNSQPFYERNGSCNQAQAQAAAPLRRYRSQEHAAGGVLCSDLALLLFLFQPQALFLMAT